ncbi:MAG: helix-turn-helix transcriptional regulator [Fibrobacteria bacterium]|nr:helix-turn-helix transcriptional regulator [Fibrobacteria bacterium]
MAANFGVDQNTWTRWENGRNYPPPKQAQKIRKLLGKDTRLLQNKFIEFKEQV